MATQEHITLSNPLFVDENTSITRVIEKGRKKQEEELAHLGAILQLVEKEVAEAKSGAIKQEANYGEKIVNLQTGNTNQAQGPSNNQFEAAMDSMVLALQMLQVLIAKYGNEKAKQDKTISDAEIALAKSNLNDIVKKLKEIQEKKDHEKTASMWEKIAEGVIGAVTFVVGCVLLQPELIVMGVLSLTAACGGFKALTDDVVEPLLIDFGVSKKVAEWFAPLITCVIVIIGSVFACDPESAGEETTEAGVEIGEDVAENAANTSFESMDVEEDALAESDNSMQALKRFGRDTKDFLSKANKVLGFKGRMLIMSSMTMLSNTEASQKVYDYIAIKDGVSKKERKKIEEEIGIAIAIASTVATIAMGIGAMDAGTDVAKMSNMTRKFMKLAKIYRQAKNAIGIGTGDALDAEGMGSLTRKLTTIAGPLQKAGLLFGGLGELATGTATGSITIQEGKLQKALAKDHANFILLQTMMEMNATETKDDQKQQASTEKNQLVGDKSLTQLMKGLEGFANLAANYSPV
ncbi:MAG: hypothetical protein K1000chlam3_01793 [Chlamydiae bacterium]|nr:hypothetical protein [Chlamydiota bacterium]